SRGRTIGFDVTTTFTGSAKELMVLQMKSLSKKTDFPSAPVDERLLTSKRFAGRALATTPCYATMTHVLVPNPNVPLLSEISKLNLHQYLQPPGNGTAGPVCAQTLSMSQLLRWKWVKSIATGIRNSRLRVS